MGSWVGVYKYLLTSLKIKLSPRARARGPCGQGGGRGGVGRGEEAGV